MLYLHDDIFMAALRDRCGHYIFVLFLSFFFFFPRLISVVLVRALNRGRHLYSAGRPSRWALTHILVLTDVIGCDRLKFSPIYTCQNEIAATPLQPTQVYVNHGRETRRCWWYVKLTACTHACTQSAACVFERTLPRIHCRLTVTLHNTPTRPCERGTM